MWPTLVASKKLNKRLESRKFLADYPGYAEQPLLGITTDDQSSLSTESLLSDQKDTQNYRVFVSTWNVGGIAPDEGLNIKDLLETCNESCDIYVLGFQEIVPLKASNVLGPENSKISMKWNKIIREALNKRTHQLFKDQVGPKKIEVKKNICPNEEGEEAPQDFECIISRQMVGILITVWARRDLCPFIQHPSVSCVGCGIMGFLGNKGSVSVRFMLHETSFCFLCTHLASGGREGDEKHRNSNIAEIFSRTGFPKGPLLDLPRKILDHDHVILLGDLNYRISLREETTHTLVEERDWDSLLQNDQHLKVAPIVKYSALSLFSDRFIPSLPSFIRCSNSGNWLLKPVTESALHLFVLISLWISSKINESRSLSVTRLKALADKSIKEQHFTTRNFLEGVVGVLFLQEVLFLQVLNFEIGSTNVAFLFLEEIWTQIKGVAKVGELINFEACMEVMDLLYEKEETSLLYRSPHSLAASILVASYVMTVPKQECEFPVLAWVKFVTSCKEEDIIKMVSEILKHVLRPS
ncbi:hypothetical protein TanjilG_31067 [Lupinus angustifolius]|uniref:Inositol polyphosphate-related phosphatase domain-containing protein n=1 Tax=Lupinus angustifolius TaxID=3871 RepID=A0A4P1R4X2_LUPAN|nr:hypothetical protein TanjilG_31067 [Lupinus angustifolius]